MSGAKHLLEERARRTRAVCEAIESAGGDLQRESVQGAARALWSWLDTRFEQVLGSRTRGGLEETVAPPGDTPLARELYAATAVCDALAVYNSADTFREMEQDARNVLHDLAAWRLLADQRS